MDRFVNDWFSNWFNEDYLALYAHRDEESAATEAAFAIDQLNLRPGMRVLDLACGAGRHAIALAQAGLDVTGLDLSAILLAKARSRAADLGLPIHLVEGDMRHLGDLGPFDAVLSFFTSFGYFDEAGDRRVLDEIYRVLRAGGSLYLDTILPSTVQESTSEEEVEGEPVHLSRRIEGPFVIKEIRFPDRSYTERVRLYSREELQSLLEDAGFAANPIPSDERLLFCARKSP